MADPEAGASAPLNVLVVHSGGGLRGAGPAIKINIAYEPAQTDKTGGFFFAGN